MRALFLVGKDLLVGRDGSTTVEDTSSDIGHKFGKTSKLILDLIGKLSSVTENDDRNLAINGFTMDNQLPSTLPKIAHTSVAKRQAQTQPSYPYQTWLDTEHLYRGWPGEYIPVELFSCQHVFRIFRLHGLPSEGCSKPRSEMARRSSGFKRKSLRGASTSKNSQKAKTTKPT